MATQNSRLGDFISFYRDYAHTGVHAASTAGLTGFGLLIQFHEAFAVLAFLSYIVPLGYTYSKRGGKQDAEADEPEVDETTPDAHDGTGTDGGSDDAEKEGDDADRWDVLDVPTDRNLFDVTAAPDSGDQSGAYAVGMGGVVLRRNSGTWETILSDGPDAEGNTLRGVDTTSDGSAVWFTGDGGALGRYGGGADRHTDHSAPDGDTSNVTDIAAVGAEGEESIVLVNGSGEVLRGRYDGETVRWGASQKPGSGSSIAAVTFVDGRSGGRTVDEAVGHAVDTNGQLFESTDGGGTWEAIGIDDAGTLTAVDATAANEIVVTDDDGTVNRYDGAVWTPVARTEESLRAVSLSDAGDADDADAIGVAVGDGGTVLERINGGWEARTPFVKESLAGVDAAPNYLVAVGDGGTILERRR